MCVQYWVIVLPPPRALQLPPAPHRRHWTLSVVSTADTGGAVCLHCRRATEGERAGGTAAEQAGGQMSGQAFSHAPIIQRIHQKQPPPSHSLPLLMAARAHCLSWDFVMLKLLKIGSSKPLDHRTHQLAHPTPRPPPVRLPSLRAASLRCHWRLLVLTGIFRC